MQHRPFETIAKSGEGYRLPRLVHRFQQEMSVFHDNFEIKDTGFVINPEFPHLGASPDGVVSCDCCGKFCLETKCPYFKRDQTFNSCVNDPKFFCERLKTGCIC